MGGLRERRLLSDHPRPMHRSMAALAALAVLAVFFGSLAVVGVESATDPFDVQALGVLYSSLNSPPQLSGWTWSGGDPCGDSWKGITCSGSAVTAMQVSGMGLNGTLGYLLSDLLSLKTLDMSNNSIHDGIPYQLPPNLTYLNLANNNLSGNLPYSIYTMVSLNYLNLSHNSLSQQIGDIFANLQDLSELDLSFNNLTGDLPNSLSSLSHLSSLYLQENQLTGPVNLLANLDLTTLNIADNNFSGWMPQEFSSIPNLITGGNTFANGPAPPPPPYVPPPPSRPHKNRNHTKAPTDTPQGPESKPFHPDNENNKKSLTAATDKEMREQRLKTASVTSLKPLPAEKMMVEKVYGKNGSGKRPKVPITATSHTIASLQIATNSFSQDSLVGEGSLGRVYRAEISNGKVLAVKKIDSAALSLQEEDNFLEAVSNMSRLRHPNIVSLVGYCVEHGQRLLVYEYIGNRTLHDMLHYADDSSNKLTWNARVRVALGTARALEYLHEVCLPSLVHRNFKSANILLDEELNPHLSDCGLAALTPNTERQVSTEMVGSFGYSAPEFAMSGVYTVKSDVYSFGIVMLELLTGRKPLDSSRERSEQSLVRWATPQLHDIDALAKMVDPALNGIYPAKSLSRFADVIALCVQPEPEFRPPMSEVVQQLVRLMQRASIVRRSSGDELGYSYRVPEHEVSMTDLSF
ncbi:protein STRUBBELIG-RECEPTOR FAMILY 8 isoform X2 [Elaeis guineensis]|uniref:Protein STRUBBELIG-RECEPTOR FAMILY 8 isoform X2 n=1 Tax=Elaeis guineensis var. tenera TaxID=51953 RepID=A0A6J0P9V4_ELAGV|nr:protein STRUBBELIG-RECEPTOR FAMILY 8 isoform X2 [Elaeis guineensis]